MLWLFENGDRSPLRSIYMLGFSQYFSSNVHHLKNSLYIWDCCSQAHFFRKKVIMKYLAINIFALNFLQLPIKKM